MPDPGFIKLLNLKPEDLATLYLMVPFRTGRLIKKTTELEEAMRLTTATRTLATNWQGNQDAANRASVLFPKFSKLDLDVRAVRREGERQPVSLVYEFYGRVNVTDFGKTGITERHSKI